MKRLNNISLNVGGYSTGIRLFRGFAFWYEMPLIYKIIGGGIGNIGNIYTLLNIRTPYDAAYLNSLTANEYMNGLSSILVQTGLLGAIFFIMKTVVPLKKFGNLSKAIALQLILILSSGTNIFSIDTIFYLVFIHLLDRDMENKEQIIIKN